MYISLYTARLIMNSYDTRGTFFLQIRAIVRSHQENCCHAWVHQEEGRCWTGISFLEAGLTLHRSNSASLICSRERSQEPLPSLFSSFWELNPRTASIWSKASPTLISTSNLQYCLLASTQLTSARNSSIDLRHKLETLLKNYVPPAILKR